MHTFVIRASQVPKRRLAWGLGRGVIVWVVAVLVVQSTLPLAAALLLLAPLIIVPLGLSLLSRDHNELADCRNRPSSGSGVFPNSGEFGYGSAQARHSTSQDACLAWEKPFSTLVNRLQFPAALLLAIAFAWSPGPWAATLAIAWFLVTVVMALWGALRLWRYPRRIDGQLCISAALIYVAVGGAWTVMSRMGLRPLGFSDEIVLLTGVHFHYAGFALPLLTGLAVPGLSVKLAKPLILGVVIGVPMVGLGITFSPGLEVASALVLAIACTALAIQHGRLALQSEHPTVLVLFAVSALSLLTAMALAAVYAIGHYLGTPWLDIPAMVPLHGLTNAFGFAICGLLAWAVRFRRILDEGTGE